MTKFISVVVLFLISQLSIGQIEITSTLVFPTCINEDFEPTNNGSIDIEITGGVPPYEIQWSNGSTSEDISDLFENYYTVQITDSEGAFLEEEFTLGIDEPYLFFETIVDPTCHPNNGLPNGEALIEVGGGLPPYTYIWEGDGIIQGESNQYNIAGEEYSVTIIDGRGCHLDFSFGLLVPNPIIIEAEIDNLSCNENGEEFGSINLEVTEAFSETYSWSHDPSITGSFADNLPIGEYEVTVTSAENCTETATINITNSPPIIIESVVTNTECSDSGELIQGTIELSTSGGVPPFDYSWSHDSSLTGSYVDDLPIGEYEVTVTSDGNCTETATFNITGSTPLIVETEITNIECSDTGELMLGTIELLPSGGIPPFEYIWSGNINNGTAQNQENLEVGIYSVTVIDSEGCQSTPIEVEITSDGQALKSPYLCLVTNDNADGNFEIYWEGPDENDGITSYNIYREGNAVNQFDLIGTVDAESDNKFIDESAISSQQAYRYYVSSANNCGDESAPSEIHKTIHLTINQGTQNNNNLIWDQYDGVTYDQITIFRGDSPTTLVEYVVLPGNIFSFSDNNLLPGDAFYQIVVSIVIDCDITKELILLKSNISTIDINNIEDISWVENIFPNPFDQNINIDLEREASMEILNYSGQTLSKFMLNPGKNTISTLDFPSGIYIVKLQSGLETAIWKGVKK